MFSCKPQSCALQPQCREDVRVLAPHRYYLRMLQTRIPTCRQNKKHALKNSVRSKTTCNKKYYCFFFYLIRKKSFF